MADTEQARRNVQDVVATTLLAMGPDMFPYLESLDLDSRAAAVEALLAQGNLPPELALALLIEPMQVGLTVLSDPLLSALMFMTAALSLELVSEMDLDSVERDAQTLEAANEEG